MLHDCFINWKRDMGGIISGFVLGRYRAGANPSVRGVLALDKARLKSNLLSSEFGREFTAGIIMPLGAGSSFPQIDLDLALFSRSPVRVKTAFLSADAYFHVALKGTAASPQLSGTIQLAQGTLHFPYQSLALVEGHIYFLSSQLQDPVVELVAKSKVKRYEITMRVGGSLQHPRISFDSSPVLTEAQIITLLLGGSEDGSLFLAMPVSLSNAIYSLIFGSVESSSYLQSYITSLFRPLNNIRIVPRVSGGSGQGDVQGSVTIEVNGNLRATVQKNFNAVQEARAEVEYGIADDMVVRAIKDEKGGIGAEIEKVWKISA
jgi:hypothetical protein